MFPFIIHQVISFRPNMEGLRHHVVQLECCGPVSVYVQVISNNLECFDFGNTKQT